MSLPTPAAALAPAGGLLARVATILAGSESGRRVRAASADRDPEVELTCPHGGRAFVHAALQPADGVVLAVTATTREAEDLAAALTDVVSASLGRYAVASFPSWETLPHERLSPRSDTVGRRLAVLRRLAHPDLGGDSPQVDSPSDPTTNSAPADPSTGPLHIVVAPIRAVLQPIATGLGDLVPVALRAGQDRPLEQVVEDLVAAAYSRTDLVERRGEFAVRGLSLIHI